MVVDPPPDGPGPGPGDAPLEALLVVQDLDTAIGQLEHRKAALPERHRLDEVRRQGSELEQRTDTIEATRRQLAGRQVQLEQQIATVTTRRQAIEQRLYASRGTASRDLQAMDEEIRHLTERQSELEDAELELMVEQEPLEAAVADLAGQRQVLASEAEDLAGALAAAEAVIDAELSEHGTARRTAAAGLPAELRDRYETLRARMGGTGAARLIGNRCGGCHLELPSMEVERIRHLPPGTVVACEQCGRILVPSSPAPTAPPVPPPGGSDPAAT